MNFLTSIDFAAAALPAGSPPLVVFFALAIGHAFADFPLQGDFISAAKNRHADLGRFFGESGQPRFLWAQVLTAHSLVHAGFVWMITGSVVLAVVELVAHWLIDFVKCEGWTGFSTDQLLHLACKLAYAFALAFAPQWF